MLPIVNESIKGEKVSIYNLAVQPKHPLNGFKLINSSKVFLMQGPITVFDDNIYAGDAKIDDIPPGSERLISYALDLSTEVATGMKRSTDVLKQLVLEGLRQEIDAMVPLVRQVMKQTRARIFRGDTHGEGKLVSGLCEPRRRTPESSVRAHASLESRIDSRMSAA